MDTEFYITEIKKLFRKNYKDVKIVNLPDKVKLILKLNGIRIKFVKRQLDDKKASIIFNQEVAIETSNEVYKAYKNVSNYLSKKKEEKPEAESMGYTSLKAFVDAL